MTEIDDQKEYFARQKSPISKELNAMANELDAMKQIALSLDKISDEGRNRCLKWAVERFVTANPYAQFEMGMIVREKVDAGKIKELEKKIDELRTS